MAEEKSFFESLKEDLGNFVNSITSGQGQNYNTSKDTRRGSQPGGSDVRAPRGMTRPKLRPKEITVPSGGGDNGGGGTRTIPFADYKPVTFQQAGLKIPKASELNYDNVPYYSGPNIRPKNMVFNPATLDSPAMYLPNTKTPGLLENLIRMRSEMPRAMATDLRLGLGSLGGIEGFTDALEGMGYGRLRDDDGNPSPEALGAYKNFQDASKDTANNLADLGGGQGDSDGCPPGYEMDYVTNMCVPSQRTAAVPMANTGLMGPQAAASAPAPAMTPFPETNPLTSGTYTPFTPLQYTQPLAYTAPTIEPEGIAGIPTAPIFPYR